MKFFLDSLFISLVVLCVILLYRLIRTKLLLNYRSRDLHPTLLPLERHAESATKFRIRYELPSSTAVTISLLDENEKEVIQLIHKDHNEGNFYLDADLGEYLNASKVLFKTKDMSILRQLENLQK